MKNKPQRKNSFRKRIWAGATLILIFMVVEGGITLFLSTQTQHTLDPVRVQHVSETNALKVKVQKLKDLLEEYATTGEDFTLEEMGKIKNEIYALIKNLKNTSADAEATYDDIQQLVDLYFKEGKNLGRLIFTEQLMDPEVAKVVRDTYVTLAAKIDGEIANEHEHLLDVFNEANANFSRSVKIIFFMTIMITVVALLYVPYLIRKITRPIIQLSDATRTLGKGNLNFEVDITSNDEFQDLGESFNFMVKNLREKTTHLENTRVELKYAMEAAESANRAKSSFLASMSHEIRTPMNAILGYAQILERDQNLEPKEQKAVHAIQRGGEHLLSLINDILDISKIEAGKMELKCSDFDLLGLIQDLSTMFRLRCEQKGLTWNVDVFDNDGACIVFGDDGKLRQVLINLLGNSVKFTDTGDIFLIVASRGNDRFYFEVRDSGIGINSAEKKVIFDPFHQEEAGFKKGGTGLGLAISRKQVELMGGDLQLASRPGEGAQFYFEIQLPESKVRLTKNQLPSARVSKISEGFQVNALVVDDDLMSRQVMETFLLDVGASVRTVEDGFQALEAVHSSPPDIIFMDFQMPGMDGIQTMKKLYQEFGRTLFKIVIVSASAFQHEMDSSFQAGCHGFITKPVRVEEVYNKLADLLGVKFDLKAEEQVDSSSSTMLSQPSFQLSRETYMKLKEAAQFGQMTDLESIVSELEIKKPESKSMTGLIREYMDRFDMDGLLIELERIDHD